MVVPWLSMAEDTEPCRRCRVIPISTLRNAQVLLAFGGGELGTVSGNTEVNFDHEIVFPEKGYNVYKVYGAGYAGLVEGNSTLNLAGGSILRGFGGACNAHVEE